MKPANSIKLIDGSQLAHVARSIHLFRHGKESEELRAPNGQLTTVLKGTLNILGSIAKQFGGENIIVAYDGTTPSWRYDIYPTYKGGLKPRNDQSDFSIQLRDMPQHLRAFGISTVQTNSLEADDILALLAERADLKDRNKILVSDDRDLLAYVGPSTFCYSQKIKTLVGPTNFEEYTKKLFKLKTGVPIGAWSVFRAMVGDSSDNIKGISNCGPSTAADVISDLTQNGVVLSGYNQGFENIQEQVNTCWPTLGKKAHQLLDAKGLQELREAYTLVQVASAPAQERKQLESVDLQCERPTEASVVEKLKELGFMQWVDDKKWISRFSSNEPELPTI